MTSNTDFQGFPVVAADTRFADEQRAKVALQSIGDLIGYGRAQQMLHDLWGDKLEARNLPRHGAFNPTLGNNASIVCTLLVTSNGPHSKIDIDWADWAGKIPDGCYQMMSRAQYDTLVQQQAEMKAMHSRKLNAYISAMCALGELLGVPEDEQSAPAVMDAVKALQAKAAGQGQPLKAASTAQGDQQTIEARCATLGAQVRNLECTVGALNLKLLVRGKQRDQARQLLVEALGFEVGENDQADWERLRTAARNSDPFTTPAQYFPNQPHRVWLGAEVQQWMEVHIYPALTRLRTFEQLAAMIDADSPHNLIARIDALGEKIAQALASGKVPAA